MNGPRRARMPLNVVAATLGGMSLIGWAVNDVLPWMQATALVFGVVLVAYAAASVRSPDVARS
jgi:hypothetical protein